MLGLPTIMCLSMERPECLQTYDKQEGHRSELTRNVLNLREEIHRINLGKAMSVENRNDSY